MKKYEKPVSQSQFEEMVREITTAKSIQKRVIYHYSYGCGKVTGYRESTGNSFEIDSGELLKAYNELDYDELKIKPLKDRYISGRVQSPACALLRELNRETNKTL